MHAIFVCNNPVGSIECISYVYNYINVHIPFVFCIIIYAWHKRLCSGFLSVFYFSVRVDLQMSILHNSNVHSVLLVSGKTSNNLLSYSRTKPS